MISITWHAEPVPANLKITLVYGLIFNEKGQMLMRIETKKDKKVYSLAGGTPEDYDNGVEATLRREMLEEVNTTLKDEIHYVGYQLIDEGNGKPPYAQVRMTALIDKLGEKQPDPDTGDTYERLLVHPEKAISLLNWGEVGKNQIEKAVEIAKEKFNIDFSKPTDEDWV